MRILLIALAASAAIATPAAAQRPMPDYDDDGRLYESLPSPEELESYGPVIDRSVGAMLDVDVGPMMDAVDPYARHPGYGRPGRTLRRMGRARDPYFDQRVRGSIYGTTAELSRMMNGLAVAAPAMRRTLFEMERSIAAAVSDYHRGAPRYMQRGPRYYEQVPRYMPRGRRYEDYRPRYVPSVPRYEEQPDYEEQSPRYEEPLARYEGRAPRYEGQGPRYDQGKPPYEEDERLYDQPGPVDDQAESVDDQPEPPNDKPETLADQIDPIYGEAEQPFVYDPDAPQDD